MDYFQVAPRIQEEQNPLILGSDPQENMGCFDADGEG